MSPYVATYPYDFGDFVSFPERMGFVRDGELDLESRSPDNCASLFQSWLFLGIICEFTQQSIELAKFVQPGLVEGGGEVLQWLRCGGEAMKSSLDRINGLGSGSPEAEILIDRCNSTLQAGALHAAKLERLNFAQNAPFPVLSFAVNVLIENLFDILQIASHRSLVPPYLPVLPYGTEELSISAKMLVSRLTKKGKSTSQSRISPVVYLQSKEISELLRNLSTECRNFALVFQYQLTLPSQKPYKLTLDLGDI